MQNSKLVEIFNENYNMVYGIIWNMVFDKQEVEDLVQRVWLRVVENADKFYYMDSNRTRNYIRVMTKNLVFNYFKEQKREPIVCNVDDFVEELLCDDDVFNAAFDDGFSEEFDIVLKKITEEEKSLIYLKYREKLKDAEIAKLLGYNDVNVRVKLHRMRKHVEKIIATREGGEQDD